MSFQLGQIIGDYEFVDVLRSSKNNVAYKVKNVLAQRFETLKIVPGDLHHDPERLERFQREIKIHARLDHPNILSFYNASVLNGHLVMTTAYVEGTTLEERLELGPLSWQQGVEYGAQIAAALAAAHGQGIVHRELTPANILLTNDDRAIISGFGQAKAAHDPRLTQKGAVVGSLFYMSPEQVRGDEHVDARSDLYSLGAVLFEMTTGQRLFSGKSHFDIMVAHVNQAPLIPASLVPGMPPPVSDAILRCVAKIPGQRFSSADELRVSLRALGAATGAAASSAAVTVPVTPRPQAAAAATTAAAPPDRYAETPSGTAARLLDLAQQDTARPAVANGPIPAQRDIPESKGTRAAGSTAPKPQIPEEMSADLASGDRKALVVLVCTLFFLLISTLVLSKLG